MPLIKEKPRTMSDGTNIITYTDSVGTSYVTYTLENNQESITITNKGIKPIIYSVGSSVDVTLNPGDSNTINTNFNSFQVKSTQGIQQFYVVMDEEGTSGVSDAALNSLDTKVNQLATQLAQKATKAEIASIGSASPKGTYATLASLQTAFPTGTTGVYVVVADGKWYYWNGSAWTAGGQYQSSGIAIASVKNNMIANSTITPVKTSFIDVPSNYDYFTNKTPYLADSNFSVSGPWADTNYDIFKIEVEENTTYVFSGSDPASSNPANVLIASIVKLMFSSNENFSGSDTSGTIGTMSSSSNSTPFATPSGCRYIYLMVAKGITNNIQKYHLQKGSVPAYPIGTTYLSNSVKVLTPYSNKKWVAFGDSLTDDVGSANMKYHKLIATELGFTVHNMGVSGSGYKNSYNDGKAFYQRANNMPADTDVITIFGSGNDSSFATTLQSLNGNIGVWSDQWNPAWLDTDYTIFENGNPNNINLAMCINHTIDNIYKIKPTVKLGIITPTPWKDGQPNESFTPIMKRIADLLIEICQRRGIPYLDLYRCSGLRPNEQTFRDLAFWNDTTPNTTPNPTGVHPNNLGHQLIAPMIREFVKSLL